MTVGDLIQILRNLERLLGAAGAGAQQRELGALANALGSAAQMNLDEWSEWFAASAEKPKKAARPQKPLNQSAIDLYVRELRAASTSECWASITAKMKNDKALDKRHLSAVASQFIGSESRYSTNAQAYTAMEEAFVERLRFDNKLKAAHLD